MATNRLLICLSAVAMLGGASSACAQDYVTGMGYDDDWTGGYAGGSLGYSYAADDKVGLTLSQQGQEPVALNGLGELDISGLTLDIHAGYRWQRDNWVFGPELAIEGGNVDDSRLLSFGRIEAESSVNYIATLAFKAGYLVDPQTLIYGVAGVNHGDFDFTLSGGGESRTQSYSADGYTLGMGAERKVNDRMSVFAEWQYRNFGENVVTFPGPGGAITTRATPEHNNLKLGVNFSF